MNGLATATAWPDFPARLAEQGLELKPQPLQTLQVNLTKLCNQACRHCHVDASPARTESMSAETVAACLDVLERHKEIGTLDITGGAPELHPQFLSMATQAVALGRRVIVRHNLTVQLDPHPQTGADMSALPTQFAALGLEVVSSLPYWSAGLTDTQRGPGVFGKSIEGLRRLNAVGYGLAGTGLILNLVYNPVGPYLPPSEASLEADYKRALGQQYGVHFNRLLALTNLPIHRFALHLRKAGQYEPYVRKLAAAFNPAAAEQVMCRTLISVGWDGQLHDCDFNQQIGLGLSPGAPRTLLEFDSAALEARAIRFGEHCFGCTAGAGSSCAGATAGTPSGV